MKRRKVKNVKNKKKKNKEYTKEMNKRKEINFEA